MKNMEAIPGGKFRVFCQGEECWITPEDVPYVVQDVTIATDEIELIFPGNYRESLNPETLAVGKGNVLYCKVRDGKFLARFNRKSYLDLAKHVKFDSRKKTYYLTIDKHDYSIKGVN